jgi:hypothetical protein
VKSLLKVSKKAILILLTIIIITTLSCSFAVEENHTTLKKDSDITPVTQPQAKTISKNATEKQLKADDETIYITRDNADDYDNYKFAENSNIVIDDTLEDYLIRVSRKNITITGTSNAKLINSQIKIINDGYVHLSNITFESNDDSTYYQTIIIETCNNTLENLVFNEYRNEIVDEFYRSLNIYGDNNIIRNCTFNVSYPSMTINWDTFEAECKGTVMVLYGNNNTIVGNTFDVKESESKEHPFGTIYAMSVNGNDNLIDLNKINMNGTIYLYALMLYDNNNVVTNNVMVIESIRYANGISIENNAINNTVRNNSIIVITHNDTIDNSGLVDAAYAIRITEYAYHGQEYTKKTSNTLGNIIDGNNIEGSSTHMYAIELFGGLNSTVSNNNIKISGSSAMGVAVVAGGTSIINNNIEVTGQTSETQASPDYLKPQTSGVYVYYGENNVVSGNSIIADTGAAIKTEKDFSTVITDNELVVENHDIVINIADERGTSVITGNKIYDILNKIINGGNPTNNYDLDDIINDNPNNPDDDPNNPDDDPNDNPSGENNNQTDTPDDNDTNNNQTDTPDDNDTNNNQTDTPDDNDTNSTDTETPNEDINQTDITPENKTEDTPKNDTEIPEPVQNNTTPTNETKPEEQVIENKTDVPEEEPIPEDQNKTEIPEEEPISPVENKTDVPKEEPIPEDQNKTDVPKEEPEPSAENKTDVPKEEPIPEDQNKTDVPEKQPESDDQNRTEVVEPIDEPISEDENKTEVIDPEEEPIPQPENKTDIEQNTTVIPEEPIQNQTIPVNNQTTEEITNDNPVNNTQNPIEQPNTVANKTSTAGQEPDSNSDGEENSQTAGNIAEPTKTDDSKDDSKDDSSDDSSDDSEDDSKDDSNDNENDNPKDNNDQSTDIKTVLQNAAPRLKIHEIIQKQLDEIKPVDAVAILAFLLVIGIALAYGYAKKR